MQRSSSIGGTSTSAGLAFRVVAGMLLVFGPLGSAQDSSLGHRSPVDVAVTNDGRWLIAINQTSGTASLIDRQHLAVVGETAVGEHPVAVVPGISPSDVWVSCRDSGTVTRLDVRRGELVVDQQFQVGYHPWGLAVDSKRKCLYVAQRARARVIALTLDSGEVTREWRVGHWPEWAMLSPNARRLVVTIPGDKGIVLVDLESGDADRRTFRALNSGRPVWSDDSSEVYLPWMVYRALAINADNIRRGWVWGSRLGRLAVDDTVPRRVLTLDERGRAVADVHGTVLSSKYRQLCVSAGGTHELLWFQLGRLPWRDYAATDHMDPRLIPDRRRFRRIDLGGRPMGMTLSPEETTVYVANYLRDSIQAVSLTTFEITREVRLGGPMSTAPARRGEEIFYDARRSLDQWYSCHTCHLDGGVNAVAIDTLNDGSPRTFKTVLPLYDVTRTPPWTWHGWQQDLRAAMNKSITSTMLGAPPTDSDVDALIAYLSQLRRPENPYAADPTIDGEAVQRGKRVFSGDVAGCAECHRPPLYTDGEIHDVGTGSPSDRYEGFNTPTLRGVYARRRLLHDGRVEALDELLKGIHSPAAVSGTRGLTDDELRDLVLFLRTL